MNRKLIGEVLELAGIVGCTVAAVQSFHHLSIAIPVAVGALLLYVGHRVVLSAGS